MNTRTTIMMSPVERAQLDALALIYRGDSSIKVTATETIHRAVAAELKRRRTRERRSTQ